MLHQPAPLAKVFHALADPSRLDMVERLARGPASIGELARAYPVSLSAVMQHVRVLEAGGLVTSRKVGRVRTCALAPGALRMVEDWAQRRRTQIEGRLDRLERHLDREES